MSEREEMPIWGWGSAGHSRNLPADSVAQLERRFGVELPSTPARSAIAADAPSASAGVLIAERLGRELSETRVSDEEQLRLLRSGGKSYPDLVRARSGMPIDVPDLVVTPQREEEIASILQICAAERCAVVPFGGGTSVTGGLAPLRGAMDTVVALDLGAISGVASLDRRSRIARVWAGTRGPELEAALSPEGLTLGHFPQSFLHASIGGFVATRSSGQSSTGYGRVDANVLGIRLAAPGGSFELDAMPGTAAGPGVRQMLIGSEGIFGVISSVDLQLAKAPEIHLDSAWLADGFGHGADLLRGLEQSGCRPTIARLSDEQETEMSLLLAGTSFAGRTFGRWVKARRGESACVMVLGWEGDDDVTRRAEAQAASVLRSMGALSLGRGPSAAWRRGRFDGPYLRDALMDRGVLVDTLETAATWSNLPIVHSAVRTALLDSLSDRCVAPIVMCHVSHLYQGGASLYYTFVAPEKSSEPEPMVEDWGRIKRAAGDAIIASGGTITHHHAVGVDHSPWMGAEIGATAVDALRAVKSRLDPEGIMNPGKVLPKLAT